MKKLTATIIIIWIITVLLNLAAFLIPGFADWYVANATPLWAGSYGRITGLAAFSIGEIMLVLAVILIAVSVVMAVLLIFIRKKNFQSGARRFFKAILFIVTLVCLVMSLNCSILYRASPLDPNPEAESRRYTVNELFTLRNHIVRQCNDYSTKFSHDDRGYLIFDGDMNEEAKRALNGISGSYPRLSGFYPNVKPMLFSGLMSRMNMSGYYFPFSLEANVNSYMYIINAPSCYCHELVHLHGYIFEDEANFLSYLACINSDNDFFAYSGYMMALNYVVNACAGYEDSLSEETLAKLEYANDIVNSDNFFLTEEMWEMANKNAVLSAETASAASSTFTDAILKANGVEDGIASYSRVVGLLLKYYDGVLY